MRETKWFKTVDDIIEYYRGGCYEKKEDKHNVSDQSEGVSGACKDRQGARHTDKHVVESVQAKHGEGI